MKLALALLSVLGFGAFLYLGLVLGFFGKVRLDYSQECEMTYMWPFFRKISFLEGIDSKYTAYLYREDGLQDLDKPPSGVPVLFIPGHGGSHKQVRSIASECARMRVSGNFESELDFYTVDLNEEFSAIHGPSIMQQAQFIEKLVKHIFRDIYERKSVIHVIGHSMGGVVATCLFTLPDFPHDYISSIFMYATPIISSPAPITHEIKDIYERIHDTLGQNQNLNNLSIISFMAGNRDLTVNSELSVIPKTVPYSLSVFTSELPFVWGSCDHQGIIWCHQVVRLTAKVLYETLDQTKKTWKPLYQRKAVYQKNLFPFLGFPELKSTPSQAILSHNEDDQVLHPDETFYILTNKWFGYNTRLSICLTDRDCASFDGNRVKGLSIKIIPGPLVAGRRSHYTFLSIQAPIKRFLVSSATPSIINKTIISNIWEYEYCTGYLNKWNSRSLVENLPSNMGFLYVFNDIRIHRNVNLGQDVIVGSSGKHAITILTFPHLVDSLMDSVVIRVFASHQDASMTLEICSGTLAEVKYWNKPISNFVIYHSFHSDKLLYPLDHSSRPYSPALGINLTFYHPPGISFKVRLERDYIGMAMQLIKRFAMVPFIITFTLYILALERMKRSGKPNILSAVTFVICDFKVHLFLLVLPVWRYGLPFAVMYLISFGFLFINMSFWLLFVYMPMRWVINQKAAYKSKAAAISSSSSYSLRLSLLLWLIVIILTPHQYTFVFTFLYHLITCLRYQKNENDYNSSQMREKVCLMWLLVYTIPLYLNAAGLMVWIKNLLISYFSFEGQDLIPSVILVIHVIGLRTSSQSVGIMEPALSKWILYGFAVYVVFYGPPNPWFLYHGLSYYTVVCTIYKRYSTFKLK